MKSTRREFIRSAAFSGAAFGALGPLLLPFASPILWAVVPAACLAPLLAPPLRRGDGAYGVFLLAAWTMAAGFAEPGEAVSMRTATVCHCEWLKAEISFNWMGCFSPANTQRTFGVPFFVSCSPKHHVSRSSWFCGGISTGCHFPCQGDSPVQYCNSIVSFAGLSTASENCSETDCSWRFSSHCKPIQPVSSVTGTAKVPSGAGSSSL